MLNVKKVKSNLSITFLNLLLRGSGILLKFYLIIIITKELSIEDLGSYSIFSTTAAILLFVLGFELHYYFSKDIIIKKPRNINYILTGNFIIYFLIFFLIISPLLFSGILKNFIESQYIVYLIIILIFDLLSQDLARIIICYNQSVLYNIIYLIKSSLWILPLFFIHSSTIDLHLILQLWFLGNIISYILGLIYLLYKKNISFKHDFFSKEYIVNSVKFSFIFFISTVIIRLINYADRYFIDYFLGKEDLGIFSFFMGIASVPLTLVSSAIQIQFSPVYIKLFDERKIQTLVKKIKLNLFLILLVYLIFALFVYFSIDLILNYLNKDLLINQVELIYFLLLVNFIGSISSLGIYLLYVFGDRSSIFLYTLVSFCCLLFFLNFTIPMFGLLGAVSSLLITYIIISLASTLKLIKKIKNGYKENIIN